MKKFIKVLLIICFLFIFVSCENVNSQVEDKDKKEVIEKMTIMFDGNGGTLVSGEENQKVENITDIVPPTYEREGYIFKGWNIDLTTITTDKIVKAEWEEVSKGMAVTFDPNGGILQDEEIVYVKKGEKVSAPKDPIREGYTFDGWFVGNEKWSFIGYTITNDITITAQWIINQYKLTIDYNDESTPIQEKILDYNSSIEEITPTREGYKLIGWSVDYPTKMPAHDLTITAKWEKMKYTIHINYGTENLENKDVVFEYGETIVLDNPTLEGYTFLNYSYEDCNHITMPARDLNVKANWKVNEYSITIVNYYGSSDYTKKINYGAPISVNTPSRIGYTFSGYSIDIPTNMPANDLVIKTNWEINTYTLTIVKNNGDENLVYDKEYNSQITEIPEVQKEGYTLKGWYNKSNYMPASDLTIQAIWEVNYYTITIEKYNYNVKNGSNSSFTKTFTYDSNIVIIDPVATGCTFKGYSEELPSKMPAHNITLSTVWEINKYKIKFVYNDNVTEDLIKEYEYNALIELPKTERVGYSFDGWGYYNSILTDESRMPSYDITVNAIWKLLKYKLKITYTIDKVYNLEYEYDYNSAIDNVQEIINSINYFNSTTYEFDKFEEELPSVMPAHDVEINAIAKLKKYKVTYDFGLENTENIQIEYEVGEEIGLPSVLPERTGYMIYDWNKSYTTMPCYDITYTAIWKKKSYNIKINNYNPIDSSSYSITRQYETYIANLSLTKNGFTFDGFEGLPDYMPASDIEVTAKWTMDNYTIYYQLNNGTFEETPITTYTVLTPTFELPIPIRENYCFIGWDYNGVLCEKLLKGSFGNRTYIAKWVSFNDLQITPTFNEKSGNIYLGKTYPLEFVVKNNGKDVEYDVKKLMTYSVSNYDNTIVSIDGDFNLTPLQVGSTKITVSYDLYNISGTYEIDLLVCEASTETYNLKGYTIKIAAAYSGLGDYDVFLPYETKDQYGYYDKPDRVAKQQAWRSIEEKYNCKIEIVAYPSDAPWGLARWQYINSSINNPSYDFYTVPSGQIATFVENNAILDLSNFYQNYGNNMMNEYSLKDNTYNNKIYGFNPSEIETRNILGYNIGLLEEIQKYDSSIQDPAQIFLDGNWKYTEFKNYCLKVQKVLEDHFSNNDNQYYALSGYGMLYWIGLSNAAGISIIDCDNKVLNGTNQTQIDAANILKDIYTDGAMDPLFQVDGGVMTWAAGHSLFCTGDLWFYNDNTRWSSDLWGNNTSYGYVPFPTSDNSNKTYFTVSYGTNTLVMASNREKSHKGYGIDCTSENIYRIIAEYYSLAKTNYSNNGGNLDTYNRDYVSQLFGNETSIEAYVYLMNNANTLGIYDPMYDNGNPIVGWYGASETFPGKINSYIKNQITDSFMNVISQYCNELTQRIKDYYK